MFYTEHVRPYYTRKAFFLRPHMPSRAHYKQDDGIKDFDKIKNKVNPAILTNKISCKKRCDPQSPPKPKESRRSGDLLPTNGYHRPYFC